MLKESISTKQAMGDILRLFGPCLVELFLTQLVSMVDMAMVGGLGTRAINAVGINTQPIILLNIIFTALNVGTTALISRAKGEGDSAKVNRVLGTAMLLSAILGLLTSTIGAVFADAIIGMMGPTSTELANMGAQYLRYRMIGMLPMALSSVATAALRGVGNSRTAMLYNLAANGVNVLFNWLLIHGIAFFPPMGVNGAALATSISQIVGMLIALGVLSHGHSGLKLGRHWGIDGAVTANILRIGLPSIVSQIVVRIGLILFTRMTISLGEVGYAAHQLCWNIINIFTCIGTAVQMVTAPLTGQSIGRGNPTHAERYNCLAALLAVGLMAMCSVVCLFWGAPLMRYLYSAESAVIEAGLPTLRLLAVSQIFFAFYYVYSGALQGAGDTAFSTVIFIITILCIRVPLAYLFKEVAGWGVFGVNLATAIDQTLCSILFYIRYKSGRWKRIKLK